MRTSRVLATIALTAAALSACGGGGGSESPNAQTATNETTEVTTTAAEATTPASDVAVSNLVATANGDLAVYAAANDSQPSSTLPALTEFGSPTTVRVLAQNADASWLLVSLPTRPNGSTGYVKADDVTLATIDRAVDVDLAARVLRVVDFGGNVILETTVAIGSEQNPTPTGNFYVTDLLDTGNDGGAYGPYALGISAHSDTLSEFGGGDAQIGLHGTNQPSSIGQAVSHGCVRLPNDVIVQLAESLPLGTPVRIH